jgi:hypothetical protein
MKKSANKNDVPPSKPKLIKDGINGCLQSGEPPEPGKRLIRGLAEKYYRRFMRVKESYEDAADAQRFDDESVKRGLILPLEPRGRKKVDDDPFEKLRIELLPPKVRKDVEEGIAVSHQLIEEQKKKPGNSNK